MCSVCRKLAESYHFSTTNTWLAYLTYLTHNHRSQKGDPNSGPLITRENNDSIYIWLLKGIIPPSATKLVLFQNNNIAPTVY